MGMVLFSARIWGEGQVFPEYKHDFFKSNQHVTVLKVATLDQAKAAVGSQAELVIWIDARLSKDNVLYVLPPEMDKEFLNTKRSEQEANPEAQIMMGSKLSNYNWEQIKAFFPQISYLKDYLTELPNTRFVVNVVDNTHEVHAYVAQALGELNPDSRILIQSDTLVIMTSIKELKPQWLYGTATADLMRLLSFDSMWILPAVQFKGDVLIAPFTLLKRPAFNEAGIEEMRRRHKKIFIGPIENTEQLSEARRLKADGLIVNDLNILR